MDIPPLKWQRIAPGWYQAELESPTGTTRIRIERRTKLKIYRCTIGYPNGVNWGADRNSLEMAKFACEWALIQAGEKELGWKKIDYTPMIQRLTIYPGNDHTAKQVVEALKALGFAQGQIRVLNFEGLINGPDRILAYRDDASHDISTRLTPEGCPAVFKAIWDRAGYVRIEMESFKQEGETVKGPSHFEWLERHRDGDDSEPSISQPG